MMSNSFGFGGTNACLVFDKREGGRWRVDILKGMRAVVNVVRLAS